MRSNATYHSANAHAPHTRAGAPSVANAQYAPASASPATPASHTPASSSSIASRAPASASSAANARRTRAGAFLAAPAHAAFEVIAETLWPTRCAVCDSLGSVLCEPCQARLAYIDACRACCVCGAPFGATQCTECNPVMLEAAKRTEVPFRAMASAVVLNDAARRIVIAYKDQGEQRLAGAMAHIMARYVSPDWTAHSTAVTFVPATASAVRRRGFDHAEELARAVAGELGLACTCLLRRPKSFDQRKLSRTQRLENMRERFGALPGATAPARLILVDDVCTTGATLYAAADALHAQGARDIYALTFARVWE